MAGAAGNKIAVVPADGTGGLIVVGHFPPVEADVRSWQQLTLNARGEFEIMLQRPLFGRRQMIDAELCERVCLQPFRLDGVVTSRAQTERAGIHASQRGVDFLQQAAYFARSAQRRDRRL